MKNISIKNILTIIGIVGSIASIIGLIYVFLPSKNNRNILIQCRYFEKLTKTDESKSIDLIKSNFESKYYYNDEEILDLWNIQLEFKNISKQTIIGKGNRKDILTDSNFIKVLLAKNIKVVEVKKLNSIKDFPNNVKFSNNEIRFYFTQWRSNESSLYSFYVTSKQQNKNVVNVLQEDIFKSENLFSSLGERQIIDGNILFNFDYEDEPFLENFLPTELLSFFIVTGKTIIITIIIGIIIFLFGVIKSFLSTKKWLRKYKKEYYELLSSLYPDDEIKINKYLKNPDLVTTEEWIDFNGKPYTSPFFMWEDHDWLFFWVFIFLIFFIIMILIVQVLL